MKIALFGATGPTGLFLIQKARKRGDQVILFGRNASRIKATGEDLRLIDGQIGDADAVSGALEGVDAVISALGPRYKSPPGLVVTHGVRNIVSGMKQHGITRLLQVSTASAPDVNDANGKMKLIIFVFRLLARNSYLDVNAAAAEIRRSGLDWTLVRIPSLYDGPATNNIHTGYYGKATLKMKLSRGNLASFLFDNLTDPTFVQKAPAISD